MKSSKHIVIITPGFPKDEQDTSCIPPLQNFVKSLIQVGGIKVSVVTLQYPHLTDSYKWLGINVYPCFKGHSKMKYLSKWNKAKKVLRRLHKELEIDLIHSFWMNEATWVAQRAFKTFKVPFIVTQMGQDVHKSNRYLPFLNLKKAYSLISVSSFQKRAFENWNVNVVSKVIPWGLDKAAFPDLNNLDRKIDILGVGNLISLKNFRDFVKATTSLRKTIPNLQAVLVGEGPEFELLKKLIKENKLEDTVRLTGALPRDEVLKLMSQSKVLYHPSKYESQGYVIYEALWSGMQVVSNEVGVAVKSLNGVHLGVNLSEQIANLQEVLSNWKQGERYPVPSISDTTDSYLELYQEIFIGG